MRNADANVIKIKHEVLEEVARLAFDGELEEHKDDIAMKLIPGPLPQFRCCIYKEREIIRQRVRLAEGKAPGIKNDGNVIQVISSACEVQNERVPIGGVPKKKKKKKPYQKEKEFLNNEMTFKNENKIQREDIEVISGGGIPNSSSITNSLNKNISSIDSDFSFDTTNKQSSIMISNVDDSNTIQYLYNPNEEDRLIEEKNKNYINLTRIKNRLSK